ncbi:hypothetical protein Tco_0664534 [Tanacetum coccineum]
MSSFKLQNVCRFANLYQGDVEVHLSSRGTAPAVPPTGLSSKGKHVIDSDSFLPGDETVHEAHDVLSKLDHQEVQRWLDGLSVVELANFHNVSALRFVMASNMLNRESPFLSSEVLKLHETVLMLKGEQSISSATITRLEARLLSVEGGSSVIDFVVVHDLMSKNEKLKKDIASLQELSQLVQYSKDILEFDIEALLSRCRKFDEKRGRVLLATNACLRGLRARAFEELVGMVLDFQLKDMKDYEPDAIDSFDKAVNNLFTHFLESLSLMFYFYIFWPVVPLEGLQVDDKHHFVEEPVEIMDREVKQLRRSRVPIVKVRWNSRRGLEFT